MKLPRIVPQEITDLRREIARLSNELAKLQRKSGRIDCPRIAAIVEQVARETGVSAGMIMSRDRYGPECRARQRVYWLANQQGMSSVYIGRVMERHHTTVLYGVRCEAERQAQ